MPNVNPNILIWARETAELSLAAAAHKLQMRDSQASTGVEKLLAYEQGNKAPTRPMIKKMAQTYRRPLLTFYLDAPPATGDRGEDFRTLPDNIPPDENVYVDALIRDIKARQSAVRETLIDEEEQTPLAFVASVDQHAEPAQVAEQLRDLLELSLTQYRSKLTMEEAFKYLRDRVEALGVFVILQGNLGSHHSNIDVTVFRGFALADDIAPFIVINDRDAKSAWPFTLLHEMAHLLMGQTGISGAVAELAVERFCNEVASECLLPANDFAAFQPRLMDTDTLAQQIGDFATNMKISAAHVSYRLFRRGDIQRGQWETLRDHFRAQWQNQREIVRIRQQAQAGGPSYYVVRRYKLGGLVDVVRRLNASGAISTTKAGMLLNVRALNVHRLFETGQAA